MSNKALSWVFDNSPYSGTKLVIHLAIADVVNDLHGNRFYASNETLARKAHTTRPTANATLHEMVEDGYLSVAGTKKLGGKTLVEYQFEFVESHVSDPDTTNLRVSDADTSPVSGVRNADTKTPSCVSDPDTNPIEINPSKEEPKELVLLEVPEEANDDVQKVWDAYLATLERCGFPTKRQLDANRKKLIRTRLKDFSVDDLVKAVEGLEFSSFHRGDNDSKKRYDGIELILRNAGNVERFIGYHDSQPNSTDRRKRVNDGWGRDANPSSSGIVLSNDDGDDFLD